MCCRFGLLSFGFLFDGYSVFCTRIIFYLSVFIYFLFCNPPMIGPKSNRKKFVRGKRIFFERKKFQMKFYSEKLDRLFDT